MKKFAMAAVVASVAVAGAAHAGMFSNGQSLLESRCAVCHPSSKAKVLKKSPEQWNAIVTGMMGRGAKLSAEEKKTLVDYLAKTYKP